MSAPKKKMKLHRNNSSKTRDTSAGKWSSEYTGAQQKNEICRIDYEIKKLVNENMIYLFMTYF